MIMPLVCVALGNLFDYASTRYGLQHGMLEANPVVNAVGLAPMKVVSTVALAGVCVAVPKHALKIALGSLAIHTAVACWNLSLVE